MQQPESAQVIPDEQGNSKEYEVGYRKPPKSGQFKKGKSGNPKGRPKDFNALRKLAQQIACEVESNESIITTAEHILRGWATSKDKTAQKDFLEIAYGKVPNRQELTGKDGGPIEHVELTDDERLSGIAELLDTARARAARQASEEA